MEWMCIGHNPTTWILGNYIAKVERNKDGSWYWNTYNFGGKEPSRIISMNVVEEFFKKEKQWRLNEKRKK